MSLRPSRPPFKSVVLQRRSRAIQRLSRFHLGDVGCHRVEGNAQIVVPTPVKMVEAIAAAGVEPGLAGLVILPQPILACRAHLADGFEDRRGRAGRRGGPQAGCSGYQYSGL